VGIIFNQKELGLMANGKKSNCSKCEVHRDGALISYTLCPDCANKNRQKVRDKASITRQKLRALVIQAYGGVCACCGESEPKFLGIDHVFNDGAAHRRELSPSRLYRFLKNQGFPKDRYQLLCHNCNLAKGFYGECPHIEGRAFISA
jgi:hypothetical protein